MICAPGVPASQMVCYYSISREELEEFASALIEKYRKVEGREESSSRQRADGWLTRKEVMALLKRCDSTLTKWARSGYLVPSRVGGKHLYKKADVMRILNGGRTEL